MGFKRNSKWAAAAVAVVALAGGAMATHAATFTASRGQTAAPAEGFPFIPPTTCAVTPCPITLDAGIENVTVADSVNGTQSIKVLAWNVNGQQLGLHTLAGGPTSTIKVPQDTVLDIHLNQPGIDLSFPSLPAASVVNHGGGWYTVTASKVGTMVFQPGRNADAPKQIAQGLVGVLIVTPKTCADPHLTCAYDGTAYADEALVATTDLDAEFAANPATFDMGYFGQATTPHGDRRLVYHLVNGQSFPNTDVIPVRASDTVLLRYVNAGVADKAMGVLGLRLSLLARNASAYRDAQSFIAPLVGPGETADIVTTIPSGAIPGQFIALSDQGRQYNHGTNSGFGGALTFLNVRQAPVVQAAVGDTTTTAADTTTTAAETTTTVAETTTTAAETTTTTTGDTTTTVGDTTTTAGDTTTTAAP